MQKGSDFTELPESTAAVTDDGITYGTLYQHVSDMPDDKVVYVLPKEDYRDACYMWQVPNGEVVIPGRPLYRMPTTKAVMTNAFGFMPSDQCADFGVLAISDCSDWMGYAMQREAGNWKQIQEKILSSAVPVVSIDWSSLLPGRKLEACFVNTSSSAPVDITVSDVQGWLPASLFSLLASTGTNQQIDETYMAPVFTVSSANAPAFAAAIGIAQQDVVNAESGYQQAPGGADLPSGVLCYFCLVPSVSVSAYSFSLTMTPTTAAAKKWFKANSAQLTDAWGTFELFAGNLLPVELQNAGFPECTTQNTPTVTASSWSVAEAFNVQPLGKGSARGTLPLLDTVPPMAQVIAEVLNGKTTYAEANCTYTVPAGSQGSYAFSDFTLTPANFNIALTLTSATATLTNN